MKDIKKYTDVVRYGNSATRGVLNVGDIISISEKLDGANASFTRDDDNFLGVTCYSRRMTLTPENTLHGFYQWVRENISQNKEKLIPNYRYYGEWMTPHKVKYKEEHKKTFKLFSIWDDESGQYLADWIVRMEADRLGLDTVEYFYFGEFISYEHLMSFVGKSNMTEVPDTGEGIVVKNVSYFNREGKQVFVKLVSEAFAEVMKQKPPKNPNMYERENAIIKSVLTKARVDKMMHKLVDENEISRDDFDISKMGVLIKLLAPRIIEDIYKEESEIISQVEESIVKKSVGRILPLTIKEVLKDYNEQNI